VTSWNTVYLDKLCLSFVSAAIPSPMSTRPGWRPVSVRHLNVHGYDAATATGRALPTTITSRSRPLQTTKALHAFRLSLASGT
jgi:hypothetical protein